MGEQIDFEASGMLNGLEGKARDSRLRLLEQLHEQGVPADELRQAATEGRLALVPVERILSERGGRYNADTVAEKSGLEREFLDRQWRALGMAVPGDDDAVFGDHDVEAAKRVAALRGAGVPDDGILEIARLLGMTMSQLAAASRSVIGAAVVADGDDELSAANHLGDATRALLPLASDSLEYALNLHLREQIRHDALAGGRDVVAGTGADRVTICFADLVGFTQLGESLEPEALGAVTGRLGELASSVVEPPVRLVKLIGDAAMLVGPEARPVLEAALELVEAAAAEGEEFPVLRAGVASGEALSRSGDWYGRPVNLASRITDRARPGSVLASEDVFKELEDDYSWSPAGSKRLKGIDGTVRVYRCRRREDSSD